jgi:predicted O-methyltransferase YrrM
MPDPKIPEVYLFDVFNDGFISPEVVKMNLRVLNLPLDKIHFIVGDSLKTVPEFVEKCGCQGFKSPGALDYILVDGCHEKEIARQDLDNVVPLLVKGGLLFFDDIAPDGCDLIDVWNDFKKAHAEEFFFHENMDGKGIGIGVKR